MRLKALTTSIAAASLAFSPVVAQAQTAPTRAGAELQQASDQFVDEEGNTNWLLVGAIVVVVAVGFYFLVIDDDSTSP